MKEKIAGFASKAGVNAFNLLLAVVISVCLFLFYMDNRNDNNEISSLTAQLEQAQEGKKNLLALGEARKEIKATIEGNEGKIEALKVANVENAGNIVIIEFQMRCTMAKNNMQEKGDCMQEAIYTNYPL